jgi:hypothetical protein
LLGASYKYIYASNSCTLERFVRVYYNTLHYMTFSQMSMGILRAAGLGAADVGVFAKAKSDPYCKVWWRQGNSPAAAAAENAENAEGAAKSGKGKGKGKGDPLRTPEGLGFVLIGETRVIKNDLDPDWAEICSESG